MAPRSPILTVRVSRCAVHVLIVVAQIFLEQGAPNPKGCSLYFVIGDADELYEFQRGNGVEIIAPPQDKPYGLRDYSVRDLYGYETISGTNCSMRDRRWKSSA